MNTKITTLPPKFPELHVGELKIEFGLTDSERTQIEKADLMDFVLAKYLAFGRENTITVRDLIENPNFRDFGLPFDQMRNLREVHDLLLNGFVALKARLDNLQQADNPDGWQLKLHKEASQHSPEPGKFQVTFTLNLPTEEIEMLSARKLLTAQVGTNEFNEVITIEKLTGKSGWEELGLSEYQIAPFRDSLQRGIDQMRLQLRTPHPLPTQRESIPSTNKKEWWQFWK